ncbi:DEAD-domain-containing protein [Agrocybe pediades]|nr:DEAD-domain-containing protein [Agrocybe pediades]
MSSTTLSRSAVHCARARALAGVPQLLASSSATAAAAAAADTGIGKKRRLFHSSGGVCFAPTSHTSKQKTNAKPKFASQTRGSTKSKKLASVAAVKSPGSGPKSKNLVGARQPKADAPKEGTNIYDLGPAEEYDRGERGGEGEKGMSYKARKRMHARESEREKREREKREKKKGNKYFDDRAVSAGSASSSSTLTAGKDAKPKVTAVLDQSKAKLSGFERDEAPHKVLLPDAAGQSGMAEGKRGGRRTKTRWEDMPRDSRVRRTEQEDDQAGRRRYNDRAYFDPEGTFRATEDHFFSRSPLTRASPSTSAGAQELATGGEGPDRVSSAVAEALARGKMGELPERMPFRDKVQIERQWLRVMDTQPGANENGREGFAYRRRKEGEDLGFVLGEVDDVRRRKENEQAWVGFNNNDNSSRLSSVEEEAERDWEMSRMQGDMEKEEEIGVDEDVQKKLERGVYERTGEFFRPSRLVQSVGEDPDRVAVPGTSSSSTTKTTSMKDKLMSVSAASAPKPDVDLQRFIDKELKDTPKTFDDAPLLDGFKKALGDMFGGGVGTGRARATPTPIQALSLRWVLDWARGKGAKEEEDGEAVVPPAQENQQKWRQYLLAAETGSGKSIAYLLPVLQSLKLSEAEFWRRQSSANTAGKEKAQRFEHNPRALILAPTHELARQLAGFAKDLVHYPDTKLRVMCASRANTSTSTTSGQATSWEEEIASKVDGTGAAVARRGNPVDVLVGTPVKILEMVYGRGWDRLETPPSTTPANELEQDDLELDPETDEPTKKLRRGRDKIPHFGKWKHRPELGLANVEWVVVDEADVLFDPDFVQTTEGLLEAVARARGVATPSTPPAAATSPTPVPATPASAHGTPSETPFNLLLTTATIPSSLNTYLSTRYPRMLRLASPRLHRLPKRVSVEHEKWTGGNKFADVLRRIRRVWAEDWGRGVASPLARSAMEEKGKGEDQEEEERLSKIIIFCNKSSKVLDLSAYLAEHGVPNVPVTSGAGTVRTRGSNRYLAGFLRGRSRPSPSSSSSTKDKNGEGKANEKPRVLITTSLLSRGLDFSPRISTVFIVDEPRNMVDFLHRAGRVGRAGGVGRVVVFGKGRGGFGGKGERRRF